MNNVIAFTTNTDTKVYSDEQQQLEQSTRLFHVDTERLLRPNGDIIPKRKGIFVEDTCVNVVSDRYKVVQPNEIVDTFTSATGLTIDSMLTNKAKGSLLIKAFLANPYIDGEEHRINLTFYTSHCGKYKTFLSMQALRMLCENQLPAITKDTGLYLMSSKHYSEFNFQELADTLETLPLHMKNFKDQYVELKDVTLSKKQFLELFVEQFKINTNSTRGNNIIEAMRYNYDNARGQRECPSDSGYKAYQALTYHLTHNGRDTVNKMEQQNIENMKRCFTLREAIMEAAA